MRQALAYGAAPSGVPYLQRRAADLLDLVVGIWIFCGGIVLFEPSPYEFAFVAVLLFAGAANMKLSRGTAGLLALIVGFIPFALIAVFQVKYTPLEEALVFSVVTIFLLLTSFFAANYVAEDTQRRMALVMRAYTAVAVVCALIGTLGYLGLIPGSEYFTRYGRAKSTFEDPNVFGPFLMLPAMFALQRVLLGAGRQQVFAALVYAVLFVGVFLSFSRAAWGHLAASSLIVLVLCFVLEANIRQRLRMVIYVLAGAGLLLVALAALLSIPPVAELFEVRTQGQTYDMGESGRFGRQGYAFDLALQNPLGLGPKEFFHLRIIEQPHNVYVTVLHHYGWGGGGLYYLLVALTLWKGVAALFHRSPLRRLMIPLLATFSMLVVESAIIDTDHWRHWFLLVGLIWGVSAAIGAEHRAAPRQKAMPAKPRALAH